MKREWSQVLKQLTWLSQMGLSLAAPLLLCLFLCSWLTSRFSIGGWIYIPGFFFGLGSSFMTAYKIYLVIMKDEHKKKRPVDTAFNEHK
ncbi:MAG: AtpZ/AtpI family protein [Enterocloster sp.]